MSLAIKTTEQRALKLAIIKGAVDLMPLNLAVLPWGVLVGSLAIQQGFSVFEAQLMSALVYAGAAQLVAIELMSNNASILTLIATIFVISSRHFLYGLTLRNKLKLLPAKTRIATAFVLTDELFAYSGHKRAYMTKVRIYYGLSAGFSFYIAWNCWTFIGIVAGSFLPDLTQMGLDFAIAVTFIALVIPSIKSVSILIAVLSSAITALVLHLYSVELELIIAAFVGMSAGYLSKGLDNTSSNKDFDHKGSDDKCCENTGIDSKGSDCKDIAKEASL